MKEYSPIKAVIEQMIQDYKMKDYVEAERVKNIWTEVVGVHVARYTTEIKLKKQILYVKINSDALRHEMNLGKENLIKNLNLAIGYEYLKALKLY